MNALNELTIHEAHQLLKEKKISSVELTEATLKQLHKVEAKIKACVTVTDEQALKDAQAADKAIAAGNITAAYRRTGANQGCYLHKRHSHYLFIQNAGEFRSAL